MELSDLRYQFELHLTETILEYTADLVTRDASVFNYRDLNLRHAVERSLYFAFLDLPAAFEAFCGDATSADPMDRSPVYHEAELEILRRLKPLDRRPNWLLPKQSRIGAVRRIWRRTKGVARNIWSSYFGQTARADRYVRSNFDLNSRIFVHLIDPKFLRYLEPILQKVNQGVMILVDSPPRFGTIALPKVTLRSIESATVRVPSHHQDFLSRNYKWMLESVDALTRVLTHSQPDRMLLVEGNSAQDEIVNQVCHQLKIATICLQQGWSPIMHVGFRNMNFDKMLVWGKGFSALFKPYNSGQKFIPVGNHLLSTTSENLNDSRAGIAFLLQGVAQFITSEVWVDFLELIVWTAKTYPSRSVIVREHPSHPLSGEERALLLQCSNIEMMSAPQFSLKNVFGKSMISVAIFSSTILESISQGVVPIIYNPSTLFHYSPDITQWNAGVEVRSQLGFQSVLAKVVEDPQIREQFSIGMKEFSREFFEYLGDSAADRIVDEIFLPLT